jgi:CheY-like chemotaxis protein
MTMVKKIFIVEDEGLVALDVEDQIRALGYEVAGIASSGEEAIELAGRLSPDLIIMDVTLQGDIDGIEAVREIRKKADPGIVFMTAHSDRATLERINHLGSVGFITKPLNTTDLRTVIEKALASQKSGNG